MRQPILAITGTLQFGIATGQTFFTPGNTVPEFGTYDYAWYSELADPASPIDTNATAATWDFSATEIAGAYYYQVTISPASATPFFTSSGGADVCWTYNYSWGNDYWYYRNGPDSLVFSASLTDIFGDDVYPNEACRQFQFGFPAAIGDVITEDVTDREGPINGLPKILAEKADRHRYAHYVLGHLQQCAPGEGPPERLE